MTAFDPLQVRHKSPVYECRGFKVGVVVVLCGGIAASIYGCEHRFLMTGEDKVVGECERPQQEGRTGLQKCGP